MNLTEAIGLRQNALSRILAGCVAIDPLWTLPQLEKLHMGALTDIQAGRFIDTVKERQNKLEGASVEDQCKLMARIACENRLQSDYMQWITLPHNLYRDVPTALKELQALAITQKTVKCLQSWIREQEAYINGR